MMYQKQNKRRKRSKKFFKALHIIVIMNPANGEQLWYDKNGNVTNEFRESDP